MQDRYFGDIGDFAKYGLLRAVTAGQPPLSLAVLWYLVPDESHNEDGRHIDYLQKTQKNHDHFRPCDPELYDRLGDLVRAGRRSVSAVVEHSLLPPGTVYHGVPLDYSTVLKEQRPSLREHWLHDALAMAADADLIFLDPDNGLEVDSSGPFDGLGPKYTFYDDLAAMPLEKSLVIYQHATREGTFAEQLEGRMDDVRSLRGLSQPNLFAMRWRRVSPRAFIFAVTDAHLPRVLDMLGAMLASRWARHFELVPAGRPQRA